MSDDMEFPCSRKALQADLRDRLSYDALKLAVKAGHKGDDAIHKA